MRHYDLADKYDKAVRHFEKGNYLRAKWLFESIVSEIESSDTESMADMNLCSSAEEYLEEIQEKGLDTGPKYIAMAILAIAIPIALILYFIFR